MGPAASGRVARGRPGARPRQGLSRIHHLAAQADWDAARVAGTYRAPSLDVEGFVHCSTGAQLAGVANAFYRGRRDLVLLTIDPARLGASLRWEAPVDPSNGLADPGSADRFPHVYGPIALDAVVAASAVVPRDDGSFAFDL